MTSRYQLLGELGRGSMGAVFRALDTALGREVAVKLIDSGAFERDELRQRFRREMSILTKLSHPSIVRLLDAGEDGGRLYYAMELVVGHDLESFIASRRPMDRDRLASVLEQLLDALDHAHTRGVIHRDIKPKNIMIEASGRAVLLDFGLAKITGATLLTEQGTRLGTVAYFSPEVIAGRSPDAASDLWSLGVVAYELAAGRRAFSWNSLTQLVNQIRHLELARLETVRGDLGPELCALIHRFLQPKPEDRWPDARTASEALARIARGPATAVGAAGPGPTDPSAPDRTVTLPGVPFVLPASPGGAPDPGPGRRSLAYTTRRLVRRIVRAAKIAALIAGALLVLAGVFQAARHTAPGPSVRPEPVADVPVDVRAWYDRLGRLSVEFTTSVPSRWKLVLRPGDSCSERFESRRHRLDAEVYPWRSLDEASLVSLSPPARTLQVALPDSPKDLVRRLARAVRTADVAYRTTDRLWSQVFKSAAATRSRLFYRDIPGLALSQPSLVEPVRQYLDELGRNTQLSAALDGLRLHVAEMLLSPSVPDALLEDLLGSLKALDRVDALACAVGLPPPFDVQLLLRPVFGVRWSHGLPGGPAATDRELFPPAGQPTAALFVTGALYLPDGSKASETIGLTTGALTGRSSVEVLRFRDRGPLTEGGRRFCLAIDFLRPHLQLLLTPPGRRWAYPVRVSTEADDRPDSGSWLDLTLAASVAVTAGEWSCRLAQAFDDNQRCYVVIHSIVSRRLR